MHLVRASKNIHKSSKVVISYNFFQIYMCHLILESRNNFTCIIIYNSHELIFFCKKVFKNVNFIYASCIIYVKVLKLRKGKRRFSLNFCLELLNQNHIQLLWIKLVTLLFLRFDVIFFPKFSFLPLVLQPIHAYSFKPLIHHVSRSRHYFFHLEF